MSKITLLPERGVLAVRGPDRVSFLNGLVSNDAALAAPGRAVWAALLTPQGKYLADFFMFAGEDALLLDTQKTAIPALLTKLTRYRLRAAVTLVDASDQYAVYVGWDGPPPPSPLAAPDPRLTEAGWRALCPAPLTANATADDYAAHRIVLGLPDGPPDLEPEKTLLLEAGFDELHGIDWKKGCYMGQELTARTKYRGLVKRRLVPVDIAQPGAAPGTPILADQREVGELRSVAGGLGLAMLRQDALDKNLTAGDAPLSCRPPAWMHLPG